MRPVITPGVRIAAKIRRATTRRVTFRRHLPLAKWERITRLRLAVRSADREWKIRMAFAHEASNWRHFWFNGGSH